jgi:hypothetical protein
MIIFIECIHIYANYPLIRGDKKEVHNYVSALEYGLERFIAIPVDPTGLRLPSSKGQGGDQGRVQAAGSGGWVWEGG